SIFRAYMKSWENGPGAVIPLVENFRSREVILNLVNSLFSKVMPEELGGVPYDEKAQLRFGAAEERRALSVAADPAPRVELHLRLKPKAKRQEKDEETMEETGQVIELQEAEKEARLVALRVRELKQGGHVIFDKDSRELRPVEWSDVAILLRSP